MQLDQTRIAIRERSFGELMGLALHVTRAGAGWIAILWLIGVLPFALFNGWLLYNENFQLDLLLEEFPVDYWSLMLMLLAIETPFATAPITLYLGKMTFNAEFRFRTMVIEAIRSVPQMILYQGILRTLMLPILMLPYWMMPYVGELILLERNPVFRGKQNRLTTNRRSRNLHSNNGGELFGRWLLTIAAGTALALAIGYGIEILITQLTSWEITDTIRHLVIYPTALWLVVGWMAVVRFLSYLDLRIRREGWEVELLMRAEAQRLRGHTAIAN